MRIKTIAAEIGGYNCKIIGTTSERVPQRNLSKSSP